jgi:hypothetical protein
MIYRREGMRHQCWSLVIVSTERGRQVGDEVLHHGLPRGRESPVYRRGHGESVFDDDPSFIVLTETKFSFRCIPVWDRYSPHRTRVEKKKHM